MSRVARALQGLDVPVRVVSDIDVLRGREPLKAIVEALGGDWQRVERDWAVIRNEVNQSSVARRRLADVRSELMGLLDRFEGEHLTKDGEAQIKRAVKVEDPWKHVKGSGVSAIPSGDATQAWRGLDRELRSIGLFVVPVGELEGWDPGPGVKGPPWTVVVLEDGLHERDGPHADFMEALNESI